jgi:leader peptidase (prepilin peptidase) / N-methyltransferase
VINQTQWLSQLPALAGIAYLFAVAPRLAVIDLRERRLPNRLVLPGMPVALLGQLVAVAINPATAQQLLNALMAGLVAFGLTLIANIRFGLGMGDVKLFVLIALTLGWFSPWLVAAVWVFASMTGVLQVGVSALRARTLRLRGTIALGPHLLAGFVLAACLAAWMAIAGSGG